MRDGLVFKETLTADILKNLKPAEATAGETVFLH
jgi:hypothetical protein